MLFMQDNQGKEIFIFGVDEDRCPTETLVVFEMIFHRRKFYVLSRQGKRRMDLQITIIFLLTFVIHIIGTLAYSSRIAGTRTGRIAVSLSLFNILLLISRTSNSFQAPLLAKRVENHINNLSNLLPWQHSNLEWDFRLLLFAATLATIVGALMIPTFQRLFASAVNSFGEHRSVPKLVMKVFSPSGMSVLQDSIRIPSSGNIRGLLNKNRIPMKVIIINVVTTAIWTVGVFSSIYAGYMKPELRATASQLSGIINGVSTILMFVFVDPYVSALTDDVSKDKLDEPFFRRSIVWLLISRLIGTLLAQVILIPSAVIIVYVAERL